MQIWQTNGRWFQLFKYVGDRFQNERGKFVTTKGDNIIVDKRQNGWASRWNVRYVKDEQTYQTGEWHPSGFYCGRKFNLISKKDGRYMSEISSKALVKMRNNKPYQQWEFHCRSESLITRGNQNLG